MKHFLKQSLLPMLAAIMILGCIACDDDEKHVAVPVAPILKEVKFPSENDIIPGQEARITGLGFSKEDKMYMTIGEETTEAEIVEVTNDYLKFIVPIDAAGEYTVIIERAGLKTTLSGTLKVPLVVPIIDVELPGGNIQQKGEVYIVGKGFDSGDVARLFSSFYPAGKEFDIPLTLASDGVKFTLPEGLYGVNSIVIVRGDRRTNIGSITIETNVGDVLGGGVVFWVDTSKAHGLIASKTTVGTPAEQFGPEVAPENASGTSEAMGTGANNTANIVNKMAQLRRDNDWPEWQGVKIAAELCDEYSATDGDLTYTDWFLPAREELIELFKAKALLAEKGAVIPANNYWTSSEAAGNTGWAAYYVNFYEETNIVSEFVSKSGWKIGVLPVRAY